MARPTKAQIKELFAEHFSFVARSERIQRAYMLDDTRSWIDPNGYQLSDRVWRAGQDVRRQIDMVLRQSIAQGEDALVTARKLEQFMNPSLAPARDAGGRLIRGQARSIVTRAPGRGGQGSFSARRLARTEISRAHAEATQFAAARTPFAKGWRWNLSGNHPKDDECDINADQDSGLGPGVYKTGQGPNMPAHPMCRCYSTIEVEQDTDRVVTELRAQYRLDET